MNAPVVSVIVLNYRSYRDTVKCAAALQKQTIADRIEILIVDNHSDDESIGFIRSHIECGPRVKVIEHRENVGYGRGNNAAAEIARGEYLLILNPDNVLPPDALEKMLTVLHTHPDIGVVGPALVHPDGTVRPSARSFPSPLELLKKRLSPTRWQEAFEKTRKEHAFSDMVDVDWIVGACLLLRTDLYRKLRGFDPRFFLFFEDIDLCRRIKEMGKRVVYLPQIQVMDRKGRLSGSSILSLLTRKTTRIHAISAVKYFLKWGLFK